MSGTTYNPGDTSAHTYVVRAVKGTCTADSTGVAGTDANNQPGVPVITAVADVSPCALSGITVAYTAGSGATSHNLLKDGSLVITGYTSGATYNPGDTNSHTYIIQAVKGTCTTNSTGVAGTDASGTPAAPASPYFTNVSCKSLTVNWVVVPGATGYNLYRKTGACGTGTKINTSAITGTSFNDAGRMSNQTYS